MISVRSYEQMKVHVLIFTIKNVYVCVNINKSKLINNLTMLFLIINLNCKRI